MGFALVVSVLLVLIVSPSVAQAQRQPMVYEGNAGGPRILEEGQPIAWVHPTVEQAWLARAGEARGLGRGRPTGNAGTSNDLTYHGGVGGIGVETAPQVFLVFWGSQWNNNDPSGEASILQSFLNGVGGSSWNNSVTQYCQGVATGTVFCNGAGTPAGNPTGILAGVWFDNASQAPRKPRQSQLAAEAVRAAQHFGNNTASSNASAQYVIATSTGNNSSGSSDCHTGRPRLHPTATHSSSAVRD